MTFAAEGLVCVRGYRQVFDNLSFSAAPGVALQIEGPNGSGKSSLLRLAAGLLRPAAGNLTWNTANIAEDPDAHRSRLVYVGHADPVKPVLTVRENLAFWGRLRGGRGDAVQPALDRLGIRHLGPVPARFLSAGQRRRLNLARLLLQPAKLWLLDEPTSTLDRAVAKVVAEIIAEHCASGGIVLVSTHGDLGLKNPVLLKFSPGAA